MFTYSMLKAIRLGYIDSATYLPAAKKAYALMIAKHALDTGVGGTLNWEGTVEVGSLSGTGSYEVSFPPSFVFMCGDCIRGWQLWRRES